MSDLAISASGLGKRYRLRESGGMGALAAKVARKVGRKKHEAPETHFWALKDVSFDIQKGEVVGIIGHNGAGKSTLLKILTRITTPTEGHAKVSGRVGMLLEVGTGFHEDLSGRENVYLGGAILGMTRAEIRHKYDDIVTFAEMDGFMDLAVRHYSSGMKLRLALSVAIHLDAEVIFLDEIWAVGDHAFQLKTWNRIEALIGSGRTFVIVAHNLDTIGRLCTRCLLFDHGKLTMDGTPAAVISRYREELRQRTTEGTKTAGPAQGDLEIVEAGLDAEDLAMGDSLDCRFTLLAKRSGAVEMAVSVRDSWGHVVAAGAGADGLWTTLDIIAGDNHFRGRLPVAFTKAGNYDLCLRVADGIATIETELAFTVVEREMVLKDLQGQDQAVPVLPIEWEIDTSSAAVRLVTSG